MALTVTQHIATANLVAQLQATHHVSRRHLLLAVRRMAGMLLAGVDDRAVWLRTFAAFADDLQRSFIDDVVISYTSDMFEVESYVG